MRCSGCGAEVDFYCRPCELPTALPDDADHFQVLGVRRRLALDTAELGDRMVARTQRVHPDHFQTAAPEIRERALAWASAINNAYRTLRDVYARARYWLELNGAALAEETDAVAPALAAQLFEAREALAAWQARPDDPQGRAALAAVREWNEAALTESRALLRRTFQSHDGADSESAAAICLSDMRREMGVLRTLMKLRSDLGDAEAE